MVPKVGADGQPIMEDGQPVFETRERVISPALTQANPLSLVAQKLRAEGRLAGALRKGPKT